MVRTSLLLADFVFVGIYVFSPTSGSPVPVRNSFNFSAASQPQCSPGAELKLLHILLNGTEVLVARRDGTGSCNASASYADRPQVSDPSLEVVDSLKEYLVSVNGAVHLQCRAVTVDKGVRSVRWKINREYVVRMNVASNKTILASRFKSRMSVPTDWFSKKDFTITLGPVQLQDQGNWTFSIQYKNGTSRNVVARVKVRETRNGTSTEQPGPIPTYHVIISVIVILGSLALAFGIWWIMSPRRNLRRQDEAAQAEVELEPMNENPDQAA